MATTLLSLRELNHIRAAVDYCRENNVDLSGHEWFTGESFTPLSDPDDFEGLHTVLSSWPLDSDGSVGLVLVLTHDDMREYLSRFMSFATGVCESMESLTPEELSAVLHDWLYRGIQGRFGTWSIRTDMHARCGASLDQDMPETPEAREASTEARKLHLDMPSYNGVIFRLWKDGAVRQFTRMAPDAPVTPVAEYCLVDALPPYDRRNERTIFIVGDRHVLCHQGTYFDVTPTKKEEKNAGTTGTPTS